MRRGFPRTLLLLGRVSNLPTVWSNCLAAWLLSMHGTALLGSIGPRFLLLLAGCSLLYVAGMYLNDVFDVGFDVRYRPERPIPAGKISRGLVGILGVGYLGTGTAILFILSGKFALLLPAAILLYNAVHKRTALSPFIMAVCRALIYPIAALSTGVLAGKLDNAGMWVAASTMAVWIILVSRVARNESVQQGSEKVSSNVVGQLLAAIPLVDMVSISPQPFVNYLPFAGCFLLAVLLGRSIPAS